MSDIGHGPVAQIFCIYLILLFLLFPLVLSGTNPLESFDGYKFSTARHKLDYCLLENHVSLSNIG